MYDPEPCILVAGGAGFSGSTFVLDWLVRSVERVVNLEALTYAGNRRNLAALEGTARRVFVHGGIGDRALVDRLLAVHRPRVVVRFAAESHVDRSILGPAAFVATNVGSPLVLLEGVRAYWRGSTRPPDGVVASTTSASTRSAAALPRAPRPSPRTTRTNRTVRSREQGRQRPPAAGLAPHLWAAGAGHETHNIGGWNEMTNRKIAFTICALLDELRPDAAGPYGRLVTCVKDRPGHDRRYAIDARKIERELGWRPAENFATGIRKTVASYLAHADRVAEVQSGSYRDWVAANYARR